MNRIRAEAKKFLAGFHGGVIIKCPEACGVNLYSTCRLHGINLEKISLDLKTVRKMVMIGRRERPIREGKE